MRVSGVLLARRVSAAEDREGIAGTFTVGLLLGANVGFVVFSLFVSGRDHDRDDEPPTQ
jgi:hypothetical protein